MTTCIGCGCTDEKACDGGCFWVAISPSELAGACSSCCQSGLIAERGTELAQEIAEIEGEWIADQASIGQDYSEFDRDTRLILPGSSEFAGVLRGYR
jgi:hypothetical protein